MTRLIHLAALPLAFSLVACAADSADDGATCVGAKCDALDQPDSKVPASPCDGKIEDRSGRKHKRVAGRLGDDLAARVFRAGTDCPTDFKTIVDKLKTADKACKDGGSGTGRFISETAQLLNKATDYRMVANRLCDDRPEHGVLFSAFGIAAKDKSVPTDVEMIAFDKTQGVFNYYLTEGGGDHLVFMGNSEDMLKGPASGDVRRCAKCHVGGGLVMKELQSPWLHWEGDLTTPGVATLATAFQDQIGSQSDGIALEGIVRGGNTAWNKTRIEFLKAHGTVADVLRPLFCTVEFNVEEEGSSKDLSGFSAAPFLDTQLGASGFFTTTDTAYQAILKANGQQVGSTGKADTVFSLAYPERAGIDLDYVEQLESKRIISASFAKDVLMVDFTRPVFSDDRCGLLQFAPTLAPADMTTTKIRDGFIANLAGQSASSPAGELLANLKNKKDDATSKLDPFIAACTARSMVQVAVGGTMAPALLVDLMKVVAKNRDLARQRPIMEFPESMPADSQTVPDGTRLDPKTCELTTKFVPVATAAPAP